MSEFTLVEEREPRLPADVVRHYVPEFLESAEWNALTDNERAGFHLVLGTATVWIEGRLRERDIASVRAFASLLEDLAASGDPVEMNAVVVDTLAILDWSARPIAPLLLSLGPRTRQLLTDFV